MDKVRRILEKLSVINYYRNIVLRNIESWYDRCLVILNQQAKKYNSSMHQHLSRIIQSIIALPLLILTITHITQNHIGQNIINLATVSLYVIGLDNILILYRWIINDQFFQYQFTVILAVLFLIGKLFQKFHPSDSEASFNVVCEWNMMIVLAINLAFVLFVCLIILMYACRQVYRLMTETLLSTSQSLQPGELTKILDMKQTFHEVRREWSEVSPTCSICLMQFQVQNQCILLPQCGHCFHVECIEGWLQDHSTCPYCRNNIRLTLL